MCCVPDVGIEPTMPTATVLQTASPPWGLSGLAGVVGVEPTTFRLTAECNCQLCYTPLAPRQGFEPQFLGPEPSVLPLDERGVAPARIELTIIRCKRTVIPFN